jgi:hypothetical protein
MEMSVIIVATTAVLNGCGAGVERPGVPAVLLDRAAM